jgi:hypothetical protein
LCAFVRQVAFVSPAKGSVRGSTFAQYDKFGHGDGKLLHLCALAMSNNPVDDECSSFGDDLVPPRNSVPPLPACFSPFNEMNDNSPDSDLPLLSLKEFKDMCDSELLEVFTNGLSFNMTSDKGHLLKGIIETDKIHT